jgi:signal peptidase II
VSAEVEAGRRGRYLLLSLGVLALDQTTKVLAHAHLRDGPAVEIVPRFFNLSYSRNAGGLFGYFHDWASPWRTVLLTVLPLVAVALIGLVLLRGRAHDRATLSGLALILGGATGNLLDRIFRGEVVDFLDAHIGVAPVEDWLVSWLGTAHWPTFNVADSAIVLGAALLLLDLLRPSPCVDGAASSSAPARTRQPL